MAGAVVFLGDFAPVIIRDHTTRTLRDWLRQVASYEDSLSYGNEKLEAGMGEWARRSLKETRLEALCRAIAVSELVLGHMDETQTRTDPEVKR